MKICVRIYNNCITVRLCLINSDPSNESRQQTVVYTYNAKKSATTYDFNDDPPMSSLPDYRMRNEAFGFEEPRKNESNQVNRWQSACTIKPLERSVAATKPLASRFVFVYLYLAMTNNCWFMCSLPILDYSL